MTASLNTAAPSTSSTSPPTGGALKGAKGDCARGCAADGDDAHAHGDGTRADGSLDAEGDGAADAEADCATEHAEALVEDEGGVECIGR